MGLPTAPFSFSFSFSFSFLSLFSTLLVILHSLPSARTASDYANLVYRGCAVQKFQDPSGVSSQNLKTLFDSLLSQSSRTSFYSTTAGEGQYAIFGLYQCRGDLGNGDCRNCLSKLPELSENLCGKAIAARVQLNGCYVRYEIAGFKQIGGTELLYKVCGSSRAGGSEFEERRDSAFQMVEKGVEGDSKGFYTASYEWVYALGQCEGDLGSGDCGDCVRSALDRAKVECGSSISGQVYLHKCYISYSYYPNGVATKGPSENKQSTEKIAAIVVGVAAAVGFVVSCLMFARTALKKK
ncbi:plasmodesmata-located protein 2 [Malania oleifera]|uniref:plasmodesmata-located protein 2 n=1 Tax=Malania oleifera TaxID=397392 RepID=UPI0025AEB494|nr:plasmodesmata-located protein 2 [Malania oleifera]